MQGTYKATIVTITQRDSIAHALQLRFNISYNYCTWFTLHNKDDDH